MSLGPKKVTGDSTGVKKTVINEQGISNKPSPSEMKALKIQQEIQDLMIRRNDDSCVPFITPEVEAETIDKQLSELEKKYTQAKGDILRDELLEKKTIEMKGPSDN